MGASYGGDQRTVKQGGGLCLVEKAASFLLLWRPGQLNIRHLFAPYINDL